MGPVGKAPSAPVELKSKSYGSYRTSLTHPDCGEDRGSACFVVEELQTPSALDAADFIPEPG